MLNNENILAMHSTLKKNTLIKIINPDNSKLLRQKFLKGQIIQIYLI